MNNKDVSTTPEPVELSYDSIMHETASAILFDVGDDKDHWIPKSLIIELTEELVTVPEWFAIKEGLV